MAKSGGSGVKKSWGTLGGNGKMHAFAGAGVQKPAVSSQEGHATGRREQKVSAGNGHGFYSSGVSNRSYAGTQSPGVSATTPSGGKSKFASGGTTKMFGNTGSNRVEGGRTSK
jgi:hypothetical protein